MKVFQRLTWAQKAVRCSERDRARLRGQDRSFQGGFDAVSTVGSWRRGSYTVDAVRKLLLTFFPLCRAQASS